MMPPGLASAPQVHTAARSVFAKVRPAIIISFMNGL